MKDNKTTLRYTTQHYATLHPKLMCDLPEKGCIPVSENFANAALGATAVASNASAFTAYSHATIRRRKKKIILINKTKGFNLKTKSTSSVGNEIAGGVDDS